MDLRHIKIGVLYIVATPIGNPRDITLRAVDILKSAMMLSVKSQDRIKTGKSIGIEIKSGLKRVSIMKHRLVIRFKRNCHRRSLALITDCGTPVFSDPGAKLIERALGLGARVIPIPGASSLMTTLSVLDVPLPRFYFAGFLPRQPDERLTMLEYLRKMHVPIVLMDTPYRMDTILRDAIKTFGSGKKAVLACDLTLPGEIVYRGNLGEIFKRAGGKKAEFILVIY